MPHPLDPEYDDDEPCLVQCPACAGHDDTCHICKGDGEIEACDAQDYLDALNYQADYAEYLQRHEDRSDPAYRCERF